MNIGIIGQGFVGTAVREGMRHAFDVWTYDKKDGNMLRRYNKSQHNQEDTEFQVGWPPGSENLIFNELVKNLDGPIFIAVPTPMNSCGSCNTTIVESVCECLDKAANENKCKLVVVIKSTVPPGTTDQLGQMYENLFVCFNPEFLTERNPIEDFKNQDRIIIGGPHEGTAVLKQMYETAYPHVQVTKTSSTIAEMVKYMTNTFLATKVSFANEIKGICDKLNVDYDKVVEYAIKDKRLGTSHWSVPGPDGKFGFGGSCFPKDLNALISLAESYEADASLLRAVWNTNLYFRPEKDWEQLKGRAVND